MKRRIPGLLLLFGMTFPVMVSAEPIAIRVDVRNLTGGDGEGQLSMDRMAGLMNEVNQIWARCDLKFVPMRMENLDATLLGVKYQLESSADINRIVDRLYPNGRFDGAVPVTIAGRWGFYSEEQKMTLWGLGWVFYDAEKIRQIGVAIDNQRLADPGVALTLAHELAHTLTLQHNSEPKNLMGPDATGFLSKDQCRQARTFALRHLGEFSVATRD